MALPVVATLIVIAFQAAGLQPRVVPALFLAAVTPALCEADLLARRLPNEFVLPGYPVALAACAAQWWHVGEFPGAALAAGGIAVAAFALLVAFGGMGMGDAKLAGVLGLSAGLVGPSAAAVAAAVGFLLGGLAAAGALARREAGGIPFGPFLLAGYWIALLVMPSPGGSWT